MAEHESTAESGFGTTLSIKQGAAYVELGELIAVTPPGYSTNIIDTTHMKSVGRRKEKRGGVIDSGAVAATLQYAPGAEAIELLHDTAGELIEAKITYPDGGVDSFKAINKDWQPGSVTVDGVYEGQLTLDVTGKPTYTDPPEA